MGNVSRYPGIANNSEKEQEEYRMLSLEAGDVLTLEEKLRDSDETDYSFQVDASFCNRILFLKDGKFVKGIEKSDSRENFYRKIQEEMRELDEIF